MRGSRTRGSRALETLHEIVGHVVAVHEVAVHVVAGQGCWTSGFWKRGSWTCGSWKPGSWTCGSRTPTVCCATYLRVVQLARSLPQDPGLLAPVLHKAPGIIVRSIRPYRMSAVLQASQPNANL